MRKPVSPRRRTQRAADKWDSARFSSLFLALGFFRLPSRVLSRPLAATDNLQCQGFSEFDFSTAVLMAVLLFPALDFLF